jgi:DNA-binding CsgD family transcriptional regulator
MARQRRTWSDVGHRVGQLPLTFTWAWAEGRVFLADEAMAYALARFEPLPARSTAASGVLTARDQREVAALIVHGLTTKHIADELVIARSTVDRHVVHILTKLGLSGRTQSGRLGHGEPRHRSSHPRFTGESSNP